MRIVVEELIAQRARCDEQMIESAALQRRVGVLAQRGKMIGIKIGEFVHAISIMMGTGNERPL